MPPKSHIEPKNLVLTTRTARARSFLARVENLNVVVPTPLSGIIGLFKRPAGTEILIDRPALAAEGISESTTTKFRAENQPLGEALEKLLEPVMAWRAVDEVTLQVTTRKELAAQMELEFYPVGKQLAGQPPAILIERIKTGLPDVTWDDAGGGKISFDVASQCLIVLQSQPVQRAIEQLLTPTTK